MSHPLPSSLNPVWYGLMMDCSVDVLKWELFVSFIHFQNISDLIVFLHFCVWHTHTLKYPHALLLKPRCSVKVHSLPLSVYQWSKQTFKIELQPLNIHTCTIKTQQRVHCGGQQDCVTASVSTYQPLPIASLELLHRDPFNDLKPTVLRSWPIVHLSTLFCVSTASVSCVTFLAWAGEMGRVMSVWAAAQHTWWRALNNSWKPCFQPTLDHWEESPVFGMYVCMSVGVRWLLLSWLFNQVLLSVLWLS